MQDVLTLKIEKKDYTVSFPNVGQLMDIESFKIAYTNGKYVQMSMSMLANHRFALDVADAVAYLSVLIPELQEDLHIKSWRSINALLAKRLVEVFYKQFIPWFKPLFKELNEYGEEESTEKDQEQGS